MSIENLSKTPHSSGVLCVMSTYRSAGAEASVRLAAIDMVLRWSKEVFRLKKIVQSLVKLNDLKTSKRLIRF